MKQRKKDSIKDINKAWRDRQEYDQTHKSQRRKHREVFMGVEYPDAII